MLGRMVPETGCSISLLLYANIQPGSLNKTAFSTFTSGALIIPLAGSFSALNKADL